MARMATVIETPALRTRTPYLALLTADGVSQTGNMLTFLAVPWFVLQTTGSAAQTGITAAVEAVAVVVAGIVGGALVDRLGHRRASIGGDLASGVAVALVPLLYHTVGLAFWQLLLLIFFAVLVDTPGWTARRSLYEVVARLGGIGLERANAGAQMVNRAAGLTGPLLAGVLIAAIGAAGVLWIDAATFLVSAGLVSVGVPRRIDKAISESEVPSSRYVAEVLDGLRFIRNDRLVCWLLAGFGLGSLLAEPIFAVVLPVYANELFGSSVDLGVMFAGLAVGSLAGNVLFIVLAPRLPRRATIVTGFAVRALAFWLLVPLPPALLVAGIIALTAVFLEPTNPISTTLFQERVPEAKRGRVFGSFLALNNVARSLGMLVYGLLLERAGLRDTLVVLAAVNVVVPLTFWYAPPLRTLATPGI
jgi:MFS family permease